MKKFYAVRIGRKSGIFTSWDECKKSVDAFPNAIYKSFSNYEQANNFMLNNKTENEPIENQKADMVAYIDGSYDDSLKRYGYAAIVFYDGEKKIFSNSDNDVDTVELRNVAGELKAAMLVMKYAKTKNASSLAIYYDYLGIEMWAKGQWRAKLKFTQDYAAYAKDIMNDIKIYFNKVKAHSGDKYNEEVDKLAKSSLKINVKEQFSSDKVTSNCNNDSENIKQILSNLKGSKNSLNIGFLINKNKLITNEDLMKVFKEKWKAKKRKLKDIEEIKAYYDVQNRNFIIWVSIHNQECMMTIGSGELDG